MVELLARWPRLNWTALPIDMTVDSLINDALTNPPLVNRMAGSLTSDKVPKRKTGSGVGVPSLSESLITMDANATRQMFFKKNLPQLS